MANKSTTKTSNTNRNNGKAWGRNHDAKAKVLSVEAEARKARKDAARAERAHNKVTLDKPGLPYTMPKITWEWATQSISGRNQHTRRSRIVATCFEYENARAAMVNKYDDPTAKNEVKSEIKGDTKISKKNGR